MLPNAASIRLATEIHEASHCAVGIALGWTIVQVTAESRNGTARQVRFRRGSHDLVSTLAVHVAGPLAETRATCGMYSAVNWKTPGFSGDVEDIRTAYRNHLAYVPSDILKDDTFRSAAAFASETLDERWSDVAAIAANLAEYSTLNGARVDAILILIKAREHRQIGDRKNDHNRSRKTFRTARHSIA